jgi:aminopeptidase N
MKWISFTINGKEIITFWINGFLLKSVSPLPKKVIATLESLTKHDDFEIRNPNRFRCIFGAFAGNNLSVFQHVDGKGYKIVTDWLLKLDKINPQTTARICTVFENWKVFDPERQKMIKKNLNRLYNLPNISKNTYEIIDAILNK